MRNVVKLVVAIFSLTVNSVNSQSTPNLPKTVTVVSESTNHSYTNSSDAQKSRSSSISVKSTNFTYKLRVYFDVDLTKKVQRFLQKELNSKHFTDTNNSSLWTIMKNNDKIFECKIKKGLVRMYVDKELTSKKFQTEIKEIGEKLKHIINGTSMENTQKERKKEAKRKLEIAKRAYEKAKRDYENQ